jgi:hypothetical protein
MRRREQLRQKSEITRSYENGKASVRLAESFNTVTSLVDLKLTEGHTEAHRDQGLLPQVPNLR